MTRRPTRSWPDWMGFDDQRSIAVRTLSEESGAEVANGSTDDGVVGSRSKRQGRTAPFEPAVTASTLLASPSQNGSTRNGSTQKRRNGTVRSDPPVNKSQNGIVRSDPPVNKSQNGTVPCTESPVEELDRSDTSPNATTNAPTAGLVARPAAVPASPTGPFATPTVTVAGAAVVNGTGAKPRLQ